MSDLNRDQDILQVINAINTDLRHDQSFCNLLVKLDGEMQRRIAKFYIEWLYKMIEKGRKVGE